MYRPIIILINNGIFIERLIEYVHNNVTRINVSIDNICPKYIHFHQLDVVVSITIDK